MPGAPLPGAPRPGMLAPWCFHSCLVTNRKNVSLLFGLCYLAVSGRSEALKLFGGGGKGNASVENSPSESGAALPSRAQGHPGCLFFCCCSVSRSISRHHDVFGSFLFLSKSGFPFWLEKKFHFSSSLLLLKNPCQFWKT